MKTPSDRPDSGDSSSPGWLVKLRSFQRRSGLQATLQLLNTVVPFALLWVGTAVIVTSELPYVAAFALILPAAFFMVRTFILFHDCCHGSFFPGRRLNLIVGHITGALTFTPYEAWRWSHLQHHATNSQLDHRGLGDVWTMTLDEYLGASKSRRLQYRVYRHPAIHFLLGPLFLFLVLNRIAPKGARRSERISTIVTNLIILASAVVCSFVLGPVAYLLVQLPILWVAGIIGVWLFYVQHQFDPGYWARDDQWNRVDASLQGASYYRLPRLLNWLTGNIGLHHIHHLLPGIPNYLLISALRSLPAEVVVCDPLTLRRSLKSIRLNLWNESERRFMSFREAMPLLRRHGSSRLVPS